MPVLVVFLLSGMISAALSTADGDKEESEHSLLEPHHDHMLSPLQDLIHKEWPEAALYSEEELREYFEKLDEGAPLVTNPVFKTRHGQGDVAWGRTLGAGASSEHLRASAGARESPGLGQGLKTPEPESPERQQSAVLDAGHQVLADQAQNSDDSAEQHVSKPAHKIPNNKITISIDAVRIRKKNGRNGLSSHVNDPQHDREDSWPQGHYRRNGHFRGHHRSSQPAEEALAVLTQMLSKVQGELGRLKEAVLLQGAVHIQTSQRLENLVLAQAKLALQQQTHTAKLLKRVRRCCSCSAARKSKRTLLRARKNRAHSKSGKRGNNKQNSNEIPFDSKEKKNMSDSSNEINVEFRNSHPNNNVKIPDLVNVDRSQSDSQRESDNQAEESSTVSKKTSLSSERDKLPLQDMSEKRLTQIPPDSEQIQSQNNHAAKLPDNDVEKPSDETYTQTVMGEQPSPKSLSDLDPVITITQHVPVTDSTLAVMSAQSINSSSEDGRVDEQSKTNNGAKSRHPSSRADRRHAEHADYSVNTTPNSRAMPMMLSSGEGNTRHVTTNRPRNMNLNMNDNSNDQKMRNEASTEARQAYSVRSTVSELYNYQPVESQPRDGNLIPPANIQQTTEMFSQRIPDGSVVTEKQSTDAKSLLKNEPLVSSPLSSQHTTSAKSEIFPDDLTTLASHPDSSNQFSDVVFHSDLSGQSTPVTDDSNKGGTTLAKASTASHQLTDSWVDGSPKHMHRHTQSATTALPKVENLNEEDVRPSFSPQQTTPQSSSPLSSTTISSVSSTTPSTPTISKFTTMATSTASRNLYRRRTTASNRNMTTASPASSVELRNTAVSMTQAVDSSSSVTDLSSINRVSTQPVTEVMTMATSTASTSTAEIPTTTEQEEQELAVDLVTGEIKNDNLPGVTWVVRPVSSPSVSSGRSASRWKRSAASRASGRARGRQCLVQGVLKFTFTPPPSPPPSRRRHRHSRGRLRSHRRHRDEGGGGGGEEGGERRKLMLELQFDRPHRWVFNLGDSIANNGFSGDGSVQENDCEAQGYGKAFAVYASDKFPNGRQKLLKVANDFLHDKLTLIVSDQTIQWDNHHGNADSLSGDSLFALSGQTDRQGPVNYDVFLGLNRVIAGHYRRGHGLCRVSARWLKA